jgi:hypothetical protein
VAAATMTGGDTHPGSETNTATIAGNTGDLSMLHLIRSRARVCLLRPTYITTIITKRRRTNGQRSGAARHTELQTRTVQFRCACHGGIATREIRFPEPQSSPAFPDERTIVGACLSLPASSTHTCTITVSA